ncbi:hypothetical protein GCM10010442_42660 [Kitasatospora kifunensis]|uniref:Integrase n=2 Tax=Kitasatospora kifunensis TaxID=58351 RepID=A0A7W7RBT3_KITKI|nr:hypothetical protein [Kitasatospora kifunensis]
MQISAASAPGSERANEDGVFVGLNSVVVLDGLSAPKDLPMGCEHGTPWFVREMGVRLLAAAEAGQPLSPSLADTIRDVAGLHSGTCSLEGGAVPATTVTVLRERDDQLDYLVLSDSVLLLDGSAGLEVLTDKRVDDVAGSLAADALAVPGGSSEQAARISALVTAQRQVRNRPGGYWVASTDPTAAEQAITGSVPRSAVRRAALLTDGATRLVDTFGELSWTELLDLLQEQGPATLIERTRQLEESDPVGARWPRFKRSDDATAACRTFITQ